MNNYDCFRLIISKLNLRYEDECYMIGFLDACISGFDVKPTPFIVKLIDCIERSSDD